MPKPIRRDERPPQSFSMDGAITHANLTAERIVGQWEPTWIRNAFGLFQWVDPVVENAMRLFMIYDGQPNANAVVVSTGPSLDRNLDELKKIERSRFKIFATTSALNPLLANGFTPDYAVINDGAAWIADLHYAGLEDLLTNVPLFINTTCHESTARRWPGPRFYYNDFAPDIPLLAEGGMCNTVYPDFWMVPVSGCTTNVATRLAFLTGCTKILMIGMDLAFSGGSAHGTKYRRGDLNIVEMVAGEPPPLVTSAAAWYPLPKSQDFYLQKARWMYRTCPVGHQYAVEEWSPSQPMEPTTARYEKCTSCNAKMRHCPTSAEYMLYMQNLLQWSQTGSETIRVNDEQVRRPYTVLNCTGDGIGTGMFQMTIEQALSAELGDQN